MVDTATRQGIIIRNIVDDESLDKLDTRPLEKTLESIDLSSYGTGIEKILFIVVALPPGSTIHENEVIYERRKRKLTLELNLDYSQVLGATPNVVLKMTAKLFLTSIDIYPKLKIRDFETKTYKDDVAKLFTFQGWLY